MQAQLEGDIARISSSLAEGGDMITVTVKTETGAVSVHVNSAQAVDCAVADSFGLGPSSVKVVFGSEDVPPGCSFIDMGIEVCGLLTEPWSCMSPLHACTHVSGFSSHVHVGGG